MPKHFEIKEVPSLLSMEPREMREAFKTIQRFLGGVAKHVSDVYTIGDIDEINRDFDHLPASVTRSAVQVIPNALATPIEWDLVNYDTYRYVDLATSTVNINILQGGVYHFILRVQWEAHAAGYRYMELWRSGSGITIASTAHPAFAPVAGLAFETMELNAMEFFPSRDTVQARLLQTSGGDLDIFNAYMDVQRVRTYDLPPEDREKLPGGGGGDTI